MSLGHEIRDWADHESAGVYQHGGLRLVLFLGNMRYQFEKLSRSDGPWYVHPMGSEEYALHLGNEREGNVIVINAFGHVFQKKWDTGSQFDALWRFYGANGWSKWGNNIKIVSAAFDETVNFGERSFLEEEK